MQCIANCFAHYKEQLTTEASAVVVIPLELLTAVVLASASSAERPASLEVVVTLTQFEIVIKPVTDLVYCVVKDCIDQWHSIRYICSVSTNKSIVQSSVFVFVDLEGRSWAWHPRIHLLLRCCNWTS